LVIQQGRNSGGVNSGAQQNGVGSKDDLLDMIQFGAAQIFNSKDNDNEGDVDIEALLAESDKKTKELNKKV
ncbi:hypothetical protein OXX80_014233, partial [Metschnikowia pulcherrima]